MLAQASAAGVGAHHLGDFRAIQLFYKVIDTGVTFFDTL
jgi:hypothetical protein